MCLVRLRRVSGAQVSVCISVCVRVCVYVCACVLTRQLELGGGARGGAAAEHGAHVVQQARRLRQAATRSAPWQHDFIYRDPRPATRDGQSGNNTPPRF